MAEKPTPRGRGALLALYKQQQEAKMGLVQKLEELPPKCVGRATALQKIREMKEKKLGGSESEQVAGPSVVTPQPQPEARAVEQISRQVSELSIAKTEPCSYRGQTGTPICATANYVHLEVQQDRGVFEYAVTFQPEIDARSNRVNLVNEALGELRHTKVYDGDMCLYLPSQVIEDKKYHNSVIPNTDTPVTVLLQYKRKKRLVECLHLYNVLFKRIMHILLYSRMGRNYFSSDHKFLVPQHKLEVLPGFAVHVDELEGGLMLCLDTQHRVIRSQTAYELLQELSASNPRNIKEMAMKNIIGACVLTKYNNKTYVIDDISWEMNPRSSFETRGGGECSFIDYYKQHHNINIQDLEQPLLLSRQTKQVNNQKVEHMICLIPELSYLTGLTDEMRSDFRVMKDVAAFTRITPNQRMLALRTYIEKVKNSQPAQDVLKVWGLRLVDGTTNLAARVLPNEAVYFGGPRAEERKFTGGTDWNRAAAENVLIGPVDLIRWQLYYTPRDQERASNFAQTLARLAKGMGCIIREPQYIVLNDDRTDTYMVAIRDNVTSEVQVTVFIVPTIRADRYSIIKKMNCCNLPVPSQVIVSKTLANPQKTRTIIHKIGMQITCKMGGSLWSVKIPVSGWMICGIDVYHGGKNESVCGFVTAINDSVTRFHSECAFQKGEVGDFYKSVFSNALAARKATTGTFPSKVIIVRDGVGDGQLDHCKRYELMQFQDVIKQLKLDITVSFVVVQKRINTRIFQMTGKTNCENPPAGTVVDSMVTRRNYYDFFLVPQSVRQGTVNPTHYIVIHDDSNIKPDHMERLMYKLCHLYFNWSGTVRVPAPCLYAHKLAQIVGQYIKRIPSASLKEKLYYL